MAGTITEDQVELILDALDSFGVKVDDDTIKRGYSGRVMFGKTCMGIVLDDDADVLKLGMALHKAFGDDDDTAERLADAARSDNLGRSTIYYFPGWNVEESDGDPDGDLGD